MINQTTFDNSHRGTSFCPEKRAYEEKQAYESCIKLGPDYSDKLNSVCSPAHDDIINLGQIFDLKARNPSYYLSQRRADYIFDCLIYVHPKRLLLDHITANNIYGTASPKIIYFELIARGKYIKELVLFMRYHNILGSRCLCYIDPESV